MIDVTASVVLTADSNEVTVVSSRKLRVGMYGYNTNLKISSVITEITDATNIVISKNALNDYTGNILFSDLNPYKFAERCAALIDVQDIIKYEGTLIEFNLRDEDNVTRDKYDSIKQKDQTGKLLLRAFPVKFSPSKELLEKVGLREGVEVMIYTATKDWLDNGINYEDISNIRSTVLLNGCAYKIVDKTLGELMGNQGVHIIFGLEK